jgi:flagellar biogenesis protein FliO
MKFFRIVINIILVLLLIAFIFFSLDKMIENKKLETRIKKLTTTVDSLENITDSLTIDQEQN